MVSFHNCTTTTIPGPCFLPAPHVTHKAIDLLREPRTDKAG